jgi:hypothetical protein
MLKQQCNLSSYGLEVYCALFNMFKIHSVVQWNTDSQRSLFVLSVCPIPEHVFYIAFITNFLSCKNIKQSLRFL